jgi:hypothetical protein
VNRPSAMMLFLNHWHGCTQCFPVKKFTMSKYLCPAGRELYAATHQKKAPAQAHSQKGTSTP